MNRNNLKTKLKPDAICKAAPKEVNLIVRMLDNETVLIEGNKTTLKFLATLFTSLSEADDNGFQLFPNGAGSSLFSKDSTLGIYIQRFDF